MHAIHDISSGRPRTIAEVDRELRILSVLPADESTRRQIDRLLDERILLESPAQRADDPRAA